MGNYRCFGCEHECRMDTGSMFGDPVKCVVTGKDVEWSKVTDISQFCSSIYHDKRRRQLGHDKFCRDCGKPL